MAHPKAHILLALLICMCVSLVFSASTDGLTPKAAYHQAELCSRRLQNSAQKMKYRENWMRCIEKFRQVYRLDPDGPWAPAGLYRSGILYQELARHSGKESDLQEARDIYERIIKRYPDSGYRGKAALKLGTFISVQGAGKKSGQPNSGSSSMHPEDEAYRAAESCYTSLRENPGKMEYRENWMQCIDKFYAVYRSDPEGPEAAAGLFMTGRLYAELYEHSRRKSDLQAAETMYERVIDNFADSRFRVKAELLIEGMPPWVIKKSSHQDDDLAQIIDPDPVSTANGTNSSAQGDLGTVENLRFWSNPNYTRVVIDASQETSYYHHLLRKDPDLKKPQRLYVDLKGARLGENIKKTSR